MMEGREFCKDYGSLLLLRAVLSESLFVLKHVRGLFHFSPMSEGLLVCLSHQLHRGSMTCLVVQYGVSTLTSWTYDRLIYFGTCVLGNESFTLVKYLSCELPHPSILFSLPT